MPSWSEIEQDASHFALRVRGRFDAGTNKTLATLRRDGAPRISASETEFSSDGEITVGMMSGSTKLLWSEELRSRFAETTANRLRPVEEPDASSRLEFVELKSPGPNVDSRALRACETAEVEALPTLSHARTPGHVSASELHPPFGYPESPRPVR